jgi:hypothetical protein
MHTYILISVCSLLGGVTDGGSMCVNSFPGLAAFFLYLRLLFLLKGGMEKWKVSSWIVD